MEPTNPVQPPISPTPPAAPVAPVAPVTAPAIPPQKSNHIILLIITVVVIVLGIGVGGAWYLLKSANKELAQNGKLVKPRISVVPSYMPSHITPTPVVNGNEKAITADVKFSYFLDPGDKNTLIFRQVDFKTNTGNDTVLPYFTRDTNDKTKQGRYVVSPDGKYIARITAEKLELATLPHPEFKTIYTAKSIISKVGALGDLNFIHIDDVMWDGDGNMYFLVGAGLDAVGPPPGGTYYTDLYTAKEDGSDVRLVNDHTKTEQNIGFGRSFETYDSAKKQIYLGGSTHGGHYARITVVDVTTGNVVSTLDDIYTDISTPQFSSDFSKAYYENTLDDSGSGYGVKIYSYDMNTKAKKVLYTVTDPQKEYIDPNSGMFYINKKNNALYFQVSDNKTVKHYMLDVADQSVQPKLTFEDDRLCIRESVSESGEYFLLHCGKDYVIYQVSTGKKSLFYTDILPDNAYPSTAIRIVSFK